MIDYSILDRYGSPWSVTLDLAAAGTTEIVRPTPMRRDPAGIAGDRLVSQYQLVVLGFAFTVVSAAAGNGFYLKSRGTDNIDRIHFRFISGGAGSTFGCVPETYIPIQKSELASPVTDPYSLYIETVGTCTIGSNVLVWGIHTSCDWGDRGYTGSPCIFPA